MRVEAIVDGGMIGGNPGKGGWGGRFQMIDADDNVIEEKFFGFSFGEEIVTNNVAEWRAVIGAMQIFFEYYFDAASWTIISDSKLVVMQAIDRWSCKDKHMEQLQYMFVHLRKALTALGHIPFALIHKRREHTMVAHDHIAKILGRV